MTSEKEELSELERKVLKYLRKNKAPVRLSEVVYDLSKNLSLKVEEASKNIFKLWKKGYIDLTPQEKKIGFISYLLGKESLWFQLISILLIITLLSVFYVHEFPFLYLRYVLGSLFVLLFPGFALIEALYPRGDELEPLERLALSIGLSLALVPLVGLILNYTPWGIRLTPVSISLAILSESLAFLAVFRKYKYFILALKPSE